MLPAFRKGLGGPLSDGCMWFSWITRDDLIGAIYHAICNEQLRGPVNGVSPTAVTNRTFTKTLGHVLHRPTLFRVPKLAAHLALGETADEVLFASMRVQPRRLKRRVIVFAIRNWSLRC